MKDNQMIPLKLVYEHDIRLAQMPVNSGFEILRDVVRKRFPKLKAFVIKYRDSDGDLVTMTCSSDLRLAESSSSSVDNNNRSGRLRLHVEKEEWVLDFAQNYLTYLGVQKTRIKLCPKALEETVTHFNKADSVFEETAALCNSRKVDMCANQIGIMHSLGLSGWLGQEES